MKSVEEDYFYSKVNGIFKDDIMKQVVLAAFLLVAFSSAGASQATFDPLFFERVDTFLKEYVEDGKVAYDRLRQNEDLANLVQELAAADVTGETAATQQAFYINAYNLFVIQAASSRYPLASVQEVGGFFDAEKHELSGDKRTLNEIEKDLLLKPFGDSRFHFVLVCGANGCPPITDFAYRPALLEEQLDAQTRQALNDPAFIRVDEAIGTVAISQIFDWYSKDFGGNKAEMIRYVNAFRDTPIPLDYRISYYAYDWTLNVLTEGLPSPNRNGNNASRYVVSAAISKGTTETKWFNNLYTQQTGDGDGLNQRSTFYTSSLSFLYGVAHRFNVGFDLRYRRVSNEMLPSSPLGVFGQLDEGLDRAGVTTIGPKIRWAPIPAWRNFSVQSAFWFPLGSDLEGNDTQPYIDWNGASWWTQFFNDFPIGSNFSLFTEVDLFWEDIGRNEDDLNRFSTPATVIFSYFPNPKTTLYLLSSYSPYWQEDFDYFAQAGLGAKYQVTPNFELEFLYTAFTNEYLQSINGQAATYNIGVRFNH